MSIVPERQVTISQVTAMYIANARAAVARFNAEFQTWTESESDFTRPPDFMTIAIEFRGYLENILGGLEDGTS